MAQTLYFGGPIFDGEVLHDAATLEVSDGQVVAVHAARPNAPFVDLQGDILAPGFVDLQVNGGGGVFVGDTPDSLTTMASAHRCLGTTALLPTLITDSPEKTREVLESVRSQMPGIYGLHLEGPHLDPRRAGAHDPALIRPMSGEECALYCASAQEIRLKLTLAPEAASLDQVTRLTEAGVTVFLGHSACSYETALDYFSAGAKGVTHLWNAMSPLTSRAPGLVGAALDATVACGIIADGLHVHPGTLRASLAAAKGVMFLVSDAMACAGTEATKLSLGGREILRQDGALRLADGTLAGADLDLRRAAQVMVTEVGVPLEQALAMATSIPADVMGLPVGRLQPGAQADLIRLSPDLSEVSVL